MLPEGVAVLGGAAGLGVPLPPEVKLLAWESERVAPLEELAMRSLHRTHLQDPHGKPPVTPPTSTTPTVNLQ